jgi:hypothetical protein
MGGSWPTPVLAAGQPVKKVFLTGCHTFHHFEKVMKSDPLAREREP